MAPRRARATRVHSRGKAFHDLPSVILNTRQPMMPTTRLSIVPIAEGQSLKAKAYDALKSAIMNMNIYDRHA
jgi:hypothetical protein